MDRSLQTMNRQMGPDVVRVNTNAVLEDFKTAGIGGNFCNRIPAPRGHRYLKSYLNSRYNPCPMTFCFPFNLETAVEDDEYDRQSLTIRKN